MSTLTNATLSNHPNIKTLGRTSEVWFIFLRNLRMIFPMWIWVIIRLHWTFASWFDFYYRYQIDTQPPSLLPHSWFDITPRPSDSQPLTSNVTPERQRLHLQLQSHALFYHLPGIYHYLKLSYLFTCSSFHCVASAPLQVLSILLIVPQPPHPTPPTNTPRRPK